MSVLRSSNNRKISPQQRANAVKISLAMLEENQSYNGPQLLLALGGNVNLTHYENNLLLDGMQHANREAGGIYWSRPMRPATELHTQTHRQLHSNTSNHDRCVAEVSHISEPTVIPRNVPHEAF